MSNSIRTFLNDAAIHAKTNYDRGKLFEEVVKIYFENDKTQQLEYDKVWKYSDWASKYRLDQSTQDIGIDLVAELRKKSGKFCAIQCKFYAETTTIQKKHVDSFVSASAGSEFARRILFDTTEGDLGKNAQSILDNTPDFFRFSFQELDQSSVNWSAYFLRSSVESHTPKQLRPHQKRALKATIEGFKKAERGQVIMACGTGKTLTALRIAETQVGFGGRVLLLVPSLALMHQTIVEWGKDAKFPLKAYAVCSDKQAGRRKYRAGTYDSLHDLMVSELVIPATTDAVKLSEECNNHHSSDALTVVYGTYQSLNVVKDAQEKYNLPKFDLTICDEAHRTTGKFEGENGSNFVMIHSNDNIQSAKRLYMTATPRIYAEQVKSKAEQRNIPLSSMDDPELFGTKFFRYGFVEAVEDGILSDYKVVVLAINEAHVANRVGRLLSEDNELLLDLTGRMLGCWKALTKVDFADEVEDKQAMRTALAFSNSIRTSKAVAENLADAISDYRAEEQADLPPLECEAKHIDGTFNAKRRSILLNWLKEDIPENHCRVLTNARCLTEGVDVPSLDAILFLEPRKSQLDVVQAVGRVMRKAEGKKRGYVILPVLIPAGVDEYTFLNQNKRFRVIWQILNALRSHDERMDGNIHKSAIGEDISSHIVITTLGFKTNGKSNGGGSNSPAEINYPLQNELVLDSEYIIKELKAQLVKRCGRADYWEDWAGDVGEIARTHITRIREVVNNPQNVIERVAFRNLLEELQDDLNPSVSEDDAIEVLAQHLVTGPVFNALFQGHQFTKENTVSQALQSVAETLKVHNLGKEAKTLDNFYKSVQRRAANVSSAAGRQHLITELYETFFKKAFPRTTNRLGIVYTPIEIVDFILKSVSDVLEDEFGCSISDEGVHVLDPFVGTGTFMTRLLNSELLPNSDLKRKYRHELHANEIVLLAYYIAGINIEAVYHERLQKTNYETFTNLCLTDTFQMQESGNNLREIFPFNSKRVETQKDLDIQVIVGNPPWSAGQRYANEDNPNLSYQALDQRITETYVSHSSATLRNSLYDSYIRAIRWSSDRIGERGVIGFVTNGGWLEGKAADGLRHCLKEEFLSLYIFNLRGNARTSGEQRRKEGGNVFGEGSRAIVTISILVKNLPYPPPSRRYRPNLLPRYWRLPYA